MSATVHFTTPIPGLDFQQSITMPRAEFTKCGRWLKVPGRDGMTIHVPASLCIVTQKEAMK